MLIHHITTNEKKRSFRLLFRLISITHLIAVASLFVDDKTVVFSFESFFTTDGMDAAIPLVRLFQVSAAAVVAEGRDVVTLTTAGVVVVVVGGVDSVTPEPDRRRTYGPALLGLINDPSPTVRSVASHLNTREFLHFSFLQIIEEVEMEIYGSMPVQWLERYINDLVRSKCVDWFYRLNGWKKRIPFQ